MDRFDPFVKYADVYGDIINWEKDPMNKPQNQNKYFFSDGKTYYEQICKMLRLMSVFKEAFNQIYSNEDEISEAWENFVNNLSASVVEGSEPDVTLTWTDDSVNFEFTMVPGVPGEQGVGITSISFNSDYTMTITLSDGNSYTSMSLKGETGPQGPQGETGSGLQILDVYATLADLQSAHPTGQPGDAYQVGSAGNYILYIWSSSQSVWVQAGTLGTVSPYTSAPLMDGTASAGSQNLYARGDHVHPSDTSRASQEELDALIKTSQALIDQSFTYRESPAIQDGLARIDKIKGNTIVWNQLINVTDGSGTIVEGVTYTTSDGVITLNGTPTSGDSLLISSFSVKANHKYLLKGCASGGGPTKYQLFVTQSSVAFPVGNRLQDFGGGKIVTALGDEDGLQLRLYVYAETSPTFTNTKFIPQIFDLTQIFGAGKEPATVVEFTSLFPLPYYNYNADSLLSFNGTGLKTVGKNIFNGVLQNGTLDQDGQEQPQANRYRSGFIRVLPNTTYCSSIDGTLKVLNFLFYDGNQKLISSIGREIVTTPSNCAYVRFFYDQTILNVNLQVEIGSTPSSYEPYTESTASLPISTYFPTGMKRVVAYDELAPNKAITRISRADLGTLNWTYDSTNRRFTSSDLAGLYNYKGQRLTPFKSAVYTILSDGEAFDPNLDMVLYSGGTADKAIIVQNHSYTDAVAFKTAMNLVYIYYELSTPVETTVDLDLSFIAYEDGTEQLLPVNGSVPSTSPVIADITYLSIDDAMEYVLEKLANVPENTQQILNALEDDVADLQEDVSTLQPAVSALQTSVGNINTNIGQLSSTVAGHTSSISDMQSDITDLNTGLSDLEDTVTDNTSRIGTLESGLSTTNGNVQNLETSVSDLGDTVTAQGTTVTALDSIISDISNNPVVSALGSHELGFVAAYVEATLAANAGTRVTIPKPVIFPNNYTPLFIVGMSTGSSDVSICEIPPTFGSRDSVSCRVWNHGSQKTAQITVYILCMRQRQSQ